MKKQVLLLAAILSIVLVLACAGCSELPVDGREVGPGGENGAAATPTATPNWVQEVTPIRTMEPEVTASPTIPVNKPETPVYAEIYSNKVYLIYDVIALSYDLKIPAMIINLEIEPDMLTDTNELSSDYGSKKWITITKTYPDPRADLIITIFDRATGEVVEEYDLEQFNQAHEEQTITLRYPGSYQIELTGNNVGVGITISVPEANLVDGEEPFSLS